MIDISLSISKQRTIREEYYKRLIGWISAKKLWTRLGSARANTMMRQIRLHSSYYFLSPVDELKTRSEEFLKMFSKDKIEYDRTKVEKRAKTAYGRFVSRMRCIYRGFMQDVDNRGVKNGYWLMKELGLKVCPYCDRNYIITIDEENVKDRPEFDHFYPEALHPSLILSFYNYVPSCPQCNHLKRVKLIDVNPWVGYTSDNRPRFRVDTSSGDFPVEPKLIVENKNKNTSELGIEELYNAHADYVKDILDKVQAYNPVTYGAIRRDFQGIVHTEAELERMVWGNYTREEDLGKRPFSKLTIDIIAQYKKYL